jgi:hypothetical protein
VVHANEYVIPAEGVKNPILKRFLDKIEKARQKGELSEFNPEVSDKGHYEGGYTDPDIDDRKPVGVVHANEFIGTADAVRNPSVKKYFDVIDYAQRNGTISRINLPPVVSTSTLKGHQSGGYTSDVAGAPAMVVQPTATTPLNAIDYQAIKDFTAIMKIAVDKGLHTNLSLFDLEKIQTKKSDLESSVDM